jgi:hypothetical protein
MAGFCVGYEESIRPTVVNSRAFLQRLLPQARKETSQGVEAQRNRIRIVPNGSKQIQSATPEEGVLRNPAVFWQMGTRLTSRKYSMEAKEA